MDTGANFYIFPHHSTAPATGPLLSGPAGQSIPCWGKKLDLSFHGHRILWVFLLVAAQFHILGVDFLRHFNLMVDPAADCLVGWTTLVPVGVPSPSGSPAAVSPLCSSAGPSVKVPSGLLGPASQVATCGPSFSVSPPVVVPSVGVPGAPWCPSSPSSARPSVKVPSPASQVATCSQSQRAASSVDSAVGSKALL